MIFLHDKITNITHFPFSIVVSWLVKQSEKIMSPTPVQTPGEPPTNHGSQTPSTSFGSHCFPLTPPSITAACCRLHLRRDSTTSSFDYSDRMEWLTYEVSVLPLFLLIRFSKWLDKGMIQVPCADSYFLLQIKWPDVY